mgnify:CR=1 FL=1
MLLLLSPAAGGAILGMFGMQWTFLVDLLTAVIAIAIMFRLKIVTRAADRSDSSVLKELREGVRYTWSQPLLRVMLVCYAVTFVLITPAAFLSPLMVVRSFGSEVWKLTANEMLWSLGALLGGAFVAWKGEFKNKITMIAVSLAVFGCTFALMGLSPFLIIAFDNVLIISLNTVIQMYGGAEADMLFDLYDNRAELYADRDDAARRHYIGNGGDPGIQFRRGTPGSDPERTEVYHIAGGGAVQHHVPVFPDAGAIFCVSLYAQ